MSTVFWKIYKISATVPESVCPDDSGRWMTGYGSEGVVHGSASWQKNSAGSGTWTHTILLPQAPEACASANSAIPAQSIIWSFCAVSQRRILLYRIRKKMSRTFLKMFISSKCAMVSLPIIKTKISAATYWHDLKFWYWNAKYFVIKSLRLREGE